MQRAACYRSEARLRPRLPPAAATSPRSWSDQHTRLPTRSRASRSPARQPKVSPAARRGATPGRLPLASPCPTCFATRCVTPPCPRTRVAASPAQRPPAPSLAMPAAGPCFAPPCALTAPPRTRAAALGALAALDADRPPLLPPPPPPLQGHSVELYKRHNTPRPVLCHAPSTEATRPRDYLSCHVTFRLAGLTRVPPSAAPACSRPPHTHSPITATCSLPCRQRARRKPKEVDNCVNQCVAHVCGWMSKT